MRISVIIPMLNEEGNIAVAIASTQSASTSQVIAVDGGSRDGSVDAARSAGAQMLVCREGRAKQLNLGAAGASGDVLLFLHADTRLPTSFDRYVAEILSKPTTSAGAFQLRIDGPQRMLRLIEQTANLRSRILQMPYGDQGIFVRADLFREIGGFPEIPIMEDLELVRRLRRRGRIEIAPASAVTSARRWNTIGISRTTIINQAAVVAYLLGVDTGRIAGWYHKSRNA